MQDLFAELKRRNVIRVAIAYAVAAWVLLQIADLVLDNIDSPAWVMQVFMLALALCFPLVVVFSWVFEMTPEGLKREKDVDRSASIAPETGQKLNHLTIGLLVIVLVIVGTERFLLPEGDTASRNEGTAEVLDKSIAVLAFEDLSASGDQDYFASGISEELLNVLAQVPDLQVAGRTSSFAFKGQNRDLREIGEILNVAHILEGSVRTSGNRIRVTAQLVKTDDGFHLFSKNYDRELTDIFQVQDDIAREIGTAMRSAILGDDSAEDSKEIDVLAYEKYLQARQWLHTRSPALMEQASVLLDEALAIDPDYAPAMAQKALALILLSNGDGSYGDIPEAEARALSRPLLDRALELDPNLAEAHAVKGLWHYSGSAETSLEAIASLERALAINPTMANAKNWLSSSLYEPSNYQRSVELLESVVERDPLYGPAFNNLTFQYLQTRELDKANTLIKRVQRIVGESPDVLFAGGAILASDGDLAEAYEMLTKAYEHNTRASVVQVWYCFVNFRLGEYDRAAEVCRGYDRLTALEVAGRSDEAEALFKGLEFAVYTSGDIRGLGDWLLYREQPDRLLGVVAGLYPNADDWIEELPKDNQLYGASGDINLIHALQATGHNDDAERLIRRTREQLGSMAANGADNPFYRMSRARLNAVEGNRDAMLSELRALVGNGYADYAGFRSVVFNPYRQVPAFMEIEAETVRRAKAERQELGILSD